MALDLDWERAVPLVPLGRTEAGEILGREVIRLQPIPLGCRNSNYVAETGDGPVLLRILLPGEGQNELEANRVLGERLPMPKLLAAVQ